MFYERWVLRVKMKGVFAFMSQNDAHEVRKFRLNSRQSAERFILYLIH